MSTGGQPHGWPPACYEWLYSATQAVRQREIGESCALPETLLPPMKESRLADQHTQRERDPQPKRGEQRDPNAAAEELGRRAKQPAQPGSPADADRREAAGTIAEEESYPQPNKG